jgi:hypothetical protein
MLRKALFRLSYSNVMATIAVFMAMGGGAYALSIPRNSVGATQIKTNAVGAPEIKTSAVRSSEVRNSSLLAEDFKEGQLPAGPQGATGATGASGTTGAQGPPGVSGLELVFAESPMNSNSGKEAVANCPAGKRVIGTGADIGGLGGTGAGPNFLTDVAIRYITPLPDLSGVAVLMAEEEPHAGNWSVHAYALCANVS